MDYAVNIPIREWAEDDRPREKLRSKGKTTLSDAELIAILIGSGNNEESAVELSKRILREAAGNNLNNLARLDVSELMNFRGIGEAKAVSIVAAMELSRRRSDTANGERRKINSSKDAYEVIKPKLLDLPWEEFWILHLNRGHQVTAKTQIGRGGVSGTVADVRLIYKAATEHLSSALILCHNHPSGTLKPSEPDIMLTKKVKEAGKIMDVAVIDHIIVGEKDYFSFADEGLI